MLREKIQEFQLVMLTIFDFRIQLVHFGSRLCKLESDVLLDARGYVNVLSDAWYSVVLTLERLIAELLNVLKID